MAVIAACNQPFAAYTTVDRIPAALPQKLPVPPASQGRFTDRIPTESPMQGISLVNIGALTTESPYLEPTVGQIWPR